MEDVGVDDDWSHIDSRVLDPCPFDDLLLAQAAACLLLTLTCLLMKLRQLAFLH